MRFIDEAEIEIGGGHGGPGAVNFRREKYVPRGGPDGGDGGAGGDVVFQASVQRSTLQDFRYRRKYLGGDGERGGPKNCAGSDGASVQVTIPVGTVVTDAETGERIIDFTEEGQTWIAAKGGRGGKGNSHFATATFQAPKFAQPGEEGQRRKLKLELKLLADAGIIGFPNAGKSTLISRISAARPKVADYAFTTLVPNLGVTALPDGESAVVADIPGLIPGAHKGLGLGHKFLKHIERTAVFIHLIDGVSLLEKLSDPKAVDGAMAAVAETLRLHEAIRRELGLFNPELLEKPEIVVLNKTDILTPELVELALATLRKALPQARATLAISAVSSEGLQTLLAVLKDVIVEARKARMAAGEPEPKLILPDAPGLVQLRPTEAQEETGTQ